MFLGLMPPQPAVSRRAFAVSTFSSPIWVGGLGGTIGALAAGSEVCRHDRDGCTTVDAGSSADEDGADAELSPASPQEDGSMLGALQPRVHRDGRLRLAR